MKKQARKNEPNIELSPIEFDQDKRADTGNGSQAVGTGSKVCNGSQEFKGMPFFLERIGLRISPAVNFQPFNMQLYFLAFCRGFI